MVGGFRSYLDRKTGDGGTNPHMNKLKLKMQEREQRLADVEERSERMAKEAGDFNDSANELANVFKNKKWWQL